MKPTGRATIADVAAAAGVSKATVSRFLNHRERLLTPDIAARVEAAIAKLAYSPSPMAQALQPWPLAPHRPDRRRHHQPYSVAVLRGAEKACQDAGYLVMLFNLGNVERTRARGHRRARGLPGRRFYPQHAGRGSGVVDAVLLQGKPAVLVDRRHTRHAHATSSRSTTTAAMKATCGHLVEGGFRELLYVTEPLEGRELAARTHRRLRCLRDGARAARGRRSVRKRGRRGAMPSTPRWRALREASSKRRRAAAGRGQCGGHAAHARRPWRGWAGSSAPGPGLRRLRRSRMGLADRPRPRAPWRSPPTPSAAPPPAA